MTIKERLYPEAIKFTIRRKTSADKYGLFCIECEGRTPANMQYREAIKHQKGCFISHLERILAL